MQREGLGSLIDISTSMVDEISFLCDCISDQVHTNLTFVYHRESAIFLSPQIELDEEKRPVSVPFSGNRMHRLGDN
jgi:hypothetical protein